MSCFSWANNDNHIKISNYELAVSLTKTNQFQVSAAITLESMAKQDAWFILNRDAVINKVTLNDEVIEFKFEVDSPSPSIYIDDGRKLSLSLKSLRGNSSKSTLSIDYVVPIASVNYLESSQHIETGLYKAWFPLNFSYSQFPFRVSLDGLTHQLAGNGVVNKKDKQVVLENNGENIDIVLMTSPSLSTKTFKAADSQVQFILFENSKETEAQLEGVVNKTLALYQNAFGSNKGNAKCCNLLLCQENQVPLILVMGLRC
ncbi:hypothetical protein [Pseudoalteromonas sp. G4]|uniref:hypothetical protein n=1 Tax=Pseudoalteromonas sp. G4 TaxID=2992761 RepID=UPI00237E5E75|nr:hypothetical protein [Pseudoalteromonas sp. G4]MDE3273943.1 hypothetical protein [Pseudoalteromonas sp. G4]